MSTSGDILAQTTRLASALRVARHLASQWNDVSHTMPLGYSSPRPYDGTARPIEDVVIAHQDRDTATPAKAARAQLQYAAQLVETAARDLSEALRRWEGSEDAEI